MMKKLASYFNPIEVRLFLTIFLSAAYFNEIDYQTGNFGRSYALTRSLGDQFSLHIDRYVGITVLDHSFYQGHYYCPVNFGASVMMLPQYLICKILLYSPLRLISSEAFTQLFIAWVTLLSSMTLYYALSFVLILRIINHITGYHTLNALALI
nr:hypothetical protein [Candidatus Delongbacteria bacterium]